MRDETLGYYALTKTKDRKGYIGSLLVVDAKGKPEEFRVTYPVKPTVLQSQLYGESMLPHIGIELCGKPLFGALTEKPAVLFVNEPQFLSLGNEIACHVVCAQSGTPGAHLVGEEEQTSTLRCATGVHEPITVRYPRGYDEARRHQVEKLLDRFFLYLNLVEPFQRIEAALKALQANDERFR